MSADLRQSLSTDVILDLLAHHRRQALLEVLRTHGEPLALPDVAEEIVVREQDKRLDAIPADDVKRIYMMLYHQHVPKLANYEVVAYDQDQDIVALTDVADELFPYLEWINEAI